MSNEVRLPIRCAKRAKNVCIDGPPVDIDTLFTNCAPAIRSVMSNQAEVEFLKCWHRYGYQAADYEARWAGRFTHTAGMSVLGYLALYSLKAGLDKVTWVEWWSQLNAKLPVVVRRSTQSRSL